MRTINIQGFEAFCREQRGLGVHTLRAYRQDLQAFQLFVASIIDDDEIDKNSILAFQRHLRETCEASPATVRRRMVTLRAYYNWIVEESPETTSPFTGLRLDLRVPQRLPRPVDRPTLAAIFRNSKHIAAVRHESSPPGATSGRTVSSATKDQVTGLMTRLLVVTGLRIGELTNAKIKDVSGAGSQIRVIGKGNRERTVYVTNERLLLDFSTHLRQRLLGGNVDAFLFLNTRGNRLTEAAFRKRLRHLSKVLQIAPYITPHRFRHSAATLLIEEGVDIRIVQRLLGHASISTTEIYTKVSDNSLFQVIECADTLAKVDS